MKKSAFVIRLITVLVAVFLIFTLLTDYRTLQSELSGLQTDLETSRNTWQSISDEKEALQEELTCLKNELREAELTVEETGPQREKILAEIEQLKLDIEALRTQNGQ